MPACGVGSTARASAQTFHTRPLFPPGGGTLNFLPCGWTKAARFRSKPRCAGRDDDSLGSSSCACLSPVIRRHLRRLHHRKARPFAAPADVSVVPGAGRDGRIRAPQGRVQHLRARGNGYPEKLIQRVSRRSKSGGPAHSLALAMAVGHWATPAWPLCALLGRSSTCMGCPKADARSASKRIVVSGFRQSVSSRLG